MKAITNQKARREWDKVCQEFTIFDEDPVSGDCIVYYLIKVIQSSLTVGSIGRI